MQTFSEIQKEPKLESNEDGGKYVEIAKLRCNFWTMY